LWEEEGVSENRPVKPKPVPTIEKFLLDKVDELIEKLVQSESNRRQAEMNFEIMQDTIEKMAMRPVIIGLTDEQVNKIVDGVAKLVIDSVGKPVIH
jgi:hypothetical protein